MADGQKQSPMQNPEKPPDEWVTKDEPITGPQRSYLQTLCREAKEEFNENWTTAEASKKIDELQNKTGRGRAKTPQNNCRHLERSAAKSRDPVA